MDPATEIPQQQQFLKASDRLNERSRAEHHHRQREPVHSIFLLKNKVEINPGLDEIISSLVEKSSPLDEIPIQTVEKNLQIGEIPTVHT
nr:MULTISPECIES: hypothetical protein [unclassified Bacillus (in: firmicutes)]